MTDAPQTEVKVVPAQNPASAAPPGAPAPAAGPLFPPIFPLPEPAAAQTQPAEPPAEPAVVLTQAEEIAAAQAAALKAEQDAAIAAAKKTADEQAAKDKAAADERASKQKAAHIVLVVGGKPDKSITAAVGNDCVPIPRGGPFTVALILDTPCAVRLPDKSEIGDVVEAYCDPSDHGSAAFVFPPKDESIASLAVSTGENVGTCVQVLPHAGRLFRKTSATNWQVLGG
jgi:hypothetical protein